MTHLKIIIEKHPECYIAYPLGLKGLVIGRGDDYEAALADLDEALREHLAAFGEDALDQESPVLEAFVAETGVTLQEKR